MERTTATELLATLADGVAELTNSTAWRAWLDVQRRFHRYSWGNTLLIAAQRPDATRVAGFHSWLRLGRHVRKGEHGIAILAPVVPRLRVVDGDSGDERWVAGRPHAFRVAHVFDPLSEVSVVLGEEGRGGKGVDQPVDLWITQTSAVRADLFGASPADREARVCMVWCARGLPGECYPATASSAVPTRPLLSGPRSRAPGFTPLPAACASGCR